MWVVVSNLEYDLVAKAKIIQLDTVIYRPLKRRKVELFVGA